mgnify:CR=1 FL=1
MNNKPLVIKTSPENPDISGLKTAARILREGGIVAFPTETVYGLGAIYDNSQAVLKVYRVKGRPIENPLILHIASKDWISAVSCDIPPHALKLADKFWPGPLTMILHKSPSVPEIVTAGLPKVAVRMPAHPIAELLIKEVGKPIAAPSANKSGRPSPTSAQHVLEDFDGEIDAIIDGGETLHGVESTILDLTSWPPVLVRPGALPVEELEKVLDVKIIIPEFARGLGEAEVAVAPGTKFRHYAPRAKMVLVEADNYEDISKLVKKVREIAHEKVLDGYRIGILCSEETANFYKDLGVVVSLGSRKNLFIVARNLFSALRLMDREGVDFIIAEGFEERGLGLTVMNRLRKASGFNIIKTDP